MVAIITLFKGRIIRNIANFCCNKSQAYRSPLCFDFTLDLEKSTSYCTLVLTYQNTSLLYKEIEKSPTMLGPVILCHIKDEEHVAMVCNVLFKKFFRLKKTLNL